MSTYCKYLKCQWNKWDSQNLKHKCNKAIKHLDEKGRCEIGDYAREIDKKA